MQSEYIPSLNLLVNNMAQRTPQRYLGIWLRPPSEMNCIELIQCIWCVKTFKNLQGYAIHKISYNDPLRKRIKYGKMKARSVSNSTQWFILIK